MHRNTLLAALPASDLQRMSGMLEPVELPLRQVLYQPGKPIEAVHFVTSGVVSLITEPDRGRFVEFGTVGYEGMAGLPLFLGDDISIAKAIVQLPGAGLRMSGADFRRVLDEMPVLRKRLMKYTLALLNQVAVTAACNRLHEVQERCARWLLQTHDRVQSDKFPLTQEFLSQMLGVHRPTVSVAAGMLQSAGLISYARGVITILDRPGLETASCSCYGVVYREFQRLLGVKA